MQIDTKENKLFAKLISKVEKKKKRVTEDQPASDGQELNPKKQKLDQTQADSDENSNDNTVNNGSVDESSSSDTDNSDIVVIESKETGNKESNLLNKLKTKITERKKEKLQKKKNEEPEQVKPDEEPLSDDQQPQPKEESNLTTEQYLEKRGFQVLPKVKTEPPRKLKPVLPVWLAFPTIVSNDLSLESEPIDDLPLIHEKIKENLKAAGVKYLFPVQRAVVPYILEAQSKPTPYWPRDICCSAPTGSGKTLAFAIPIVQHLLNRVERKVQALVILPVQELAQQVATVFKQVCAGTKITPILLSKANPMVKEQSMLLEKVNGKYYSKVDVIVTTAGRLVEHLHRTDGFSLRDLRFLIIDEADRVMDQIQNDWLYHLNKHVQVESEALLMGKPLPLSVNGIRGTPRPPQKLLFSATLSQDPEKLKQFRLFQPKLFTSIVPNKENSDNEPDVQLISTKTKDSLGSEIRGDFVGRYTTPAGLTEHFCLTEPRLKPLTLYCLLKEHNWRRFLCFTNSAEASHRLSFVLQELFGDELIIEELSSTLSLAARKAVLHRFATFKVNAIISTDALARGIDIPAVDVVLSYDAPKHIKTYIHRIGRTARAGQTGTAVTLLEKTQQKPFQKIISTAGKENVTEMSRATDLEELKALDYANVLKALQKALEKEKKVMKQRGRVRDNSAPKSLLDKIKEQISNEEASFFKHHIPESWKEEAIKEQAILNAERIKKLGPDAKKNKKVTKKERQRNIKKEKAAYVKQS